MLTDGWHQVTRRTRLHVSGGLPTEVETTAYDLDAALDAAAQFYGEPLERTGPWLTADGRDPGMDRFITVTCSVDTAARVHGDE